MALEERSWGNCRNGNKTFLRNPDISLCDILSQTEMFVAGKFCPDGGGRGSHWLTKIIRDQHFGSSNVHIKIHKCLMSQKHKKISCKFFRNTLKQSYSS